MRRRRYCTCHGNTRRAEGVDVSRRSPPPPRGSHSVAWIVCARLPVAPGWLPDSLFAPCRPARSMMAGAGSGRSAGIDIIGIDNIDNIIDTNGLCIIIAILSRSVLNRITGHPASHVAPVVALPKKLISMLFFYRCAITYSGYSSTKVPNYRLCHNIQQRDNLNTRGTRVPWYSNRPSGTRQAGR